MDLDYLTKYHLMEKINPLLKKWWLTGEKLKKIIDEVDDSFMWMRDLLKKIDPDWLELYKAQLFAKTTPYISISALWVTAKDVDSYSKINAFDNAILQSAEWDTQFLSNFYITKSDWEVVPLSSATPRELPKEDSIDYSTPIRWEVVEYDEVVEWYTSHYDPRQERKFLDDIDYKRAELEKSQNDYIRQQNSLWYWKISPFLWLSSLNSVLKTTPMLNRIRNSVLLLLPRQAALASEAIRLIYKDWWEEAFESMKQTLKDSFNKETNMFDTTKIINQETVLWLWMVKIMDYFNSLKKSLISVWVEEELMKDAFSNIHKYLFSISWTAWIKSAQDIIKNQKFLLMARWVSKEVNQILTEKWWDISKEAIEYLRKTFAGEWDLLSDSSIKLIYDNVASNWFMSKLSRWFNARLPRISKWFSVLSTSWRRLAGRTVWAVYSAFVQTATYWTEYVLNFNKNLWPADEIWKIIWRWVEQWAELWEALKYPIKKAFWWIWKDFKYNDSAEEVLRKSLNRAMMNEELRYWLNQLVDMAFRKMLKWRAMYDAVNKHWFPDLDSFKRFLDNTPDSSEYKKVIVDKVKASATEFFWWSSWFGVWVLQSASWRGFLWAFRTLFDFKWSRWFNRARALFDNIWWNFFHWTKKFYKVLRSDWYAKAVEFLDDWMSSNRELKWALDDLLRYLYINNKIKLYTEKDVDPYWPDSIKSEFDAFLKTLSMFYAPIQAIESTALWRLVDTTLDVVFSSGWKFTGKDPAYRMYYRYSKFLWEFWKQFKIYWNLVKATRPAMDWDYEWSMAALLNVFWDTSLWYMRYVANEISSPTWMEDIPKPYLNDLEEIIWRWSNPMNELRYQTMIYAAYLKDKDLKEKDTNELIANVIKNDFIWKIPLLREVIKAIWGNLWNSYVDIDKFYEAIWSDKVVYAWNSDKKLNMYDIMTSVNSKWDNFYWVTMRDYIWDRLTFQDEEWWKIPWVWLAWYWDDVMKIFPEENQNPLMKSFFDYVENWYADPDAVYRVISMWQNKTKRQLLETMVLLDAAESSWKLKSEQIVWLSRSLLWFVANSYLDQEKKKLWIELMQPITWKKTLYWGSEWVLVDDAKDRFLATFWDVIADVDTVFANDIVNQYVYWKNDDKRDIMDSFYNISRTFEWWAWEKKYTVEMKQAYKQATLAQHLTSVCINNGGVWCDAYQTAFGPLLNYLPVNVKVKVRQWVREDMKRMDIPEIEKLYHSQKMLATHPDMLYAIDEIRAISPETADEFQNDLYWENKAIINLAKTEVDYKKEAEFGWWKNSVITSPDIKMEDFEPMLKKFRDFVEANPWKILTPPTIKNDIQTVYNAWKYLSKSRREHIIKSAKLAESFRWQQTVAKSEAYDTTAKWGSTVKW